jgi:hypothetical protein
VKLATHFVFPVVLFAGFSATLLGWQFFDIGAIVGAYAGAVATSGPETPAPFAPRAAEKPVELIALPMLPKQDRVCFGWFLGLVDAMKPKRG